MFPNPDTLAERKKSPGLLLEISLVISAKPGESVSLTLTHAYLAERCHIGTCPFRRQWPWDGTHPCSHPEQVHICKQELGQHEGLSLHVERLIWVSVISKFKTLSIQMSASHTQFYMTKCSTLDSYIITLDTYYLDRGAK